MGKALNKVPDALHMSSDVDERACCAIATFYSCSCCLSMCANIFVDRAKKEADKERAASNIYQSVYGDDLNNLNQDVLYHNTNHVQGGPHSKPPKMHSTGFV